jgi:site-specific DNA-methyltransferase (adenine-specific)
MEINKTYLGDCLEVMKSIPDKYIDMILCDLPYGVTKNKWDSVINLELLWEQYNRITKENSPIILFGQDKFTSKLMLSNEKIHRYNLIWDKGNRGSGFLNAKKMPLRNHEDIIVFYKKLPTYNPQFTEGEPLHGMGTKYKDGNLGNNNYGKFDSRKNPSANRKGDTKKYPKSILRFDRPHPPIHPTQKSQELCEYLIKTYSNEDNIILDNCAGCGTTGLAAKNTKRNFILIENNPMYYDMCVDRLNQIGVKENLEK